MPATALLAAVASQTLAELCAVPECRGASLGLGREPALTGAGLALAGLAGLLVGKPALNIPVGHGYANVLSAVSPKGLPSESRQTAQ